MGPTSIKIKSNSNSNDNNNNSTTVTASTPTATTNSLQSTKINQLATQTDDLKYRTKYKELKVKLNEVEVDNTQLHIKILKSKKAIQRLRLERSILYDRLQSSVIPTNPFSLHANPHLSSLNSTASTSTLSIPPPNIQQIPTTYTLLNPEAPSIYLESLNAKKLSLLTNNTNQLEEIESETKTNWGERTDFGIDYSEVTGSSSGASNGNGNVKESNQIQSGGSILFGDGPTGERMQVDS